MLFEKRAVGMEIGRDGIKFVSLTGIKEGLRLNSFSCAPLPPDSIRFSFKEPNVADPAAFSAVVKAAYLKLLEKGTRVSVSLPDSVGRVLLVEVDSRFRNKEEGAEIILWKLRKSSSIEVERTHLDYQVLGESETGGLRVLAALMSKPVIRQYEEILQGAGLEPFRIDFTSFNLYHLFADRLETAPDSIMISLYGSLATIMVFRNGILDFFRAKEVASGNVGDRLYQEMSNSLLAYRQNNPAYETAAVYCLAQREAWDDVSHIVTETVGTEPRLLSVESLFASGEGSPPDASTAYLVAAPVGAAARSL